MKMPKIHLNALKIREAFRNLVSGVTLPPGMLKEIRRLQCRAQRLAKYRFRNTHYPYMSTRQQRRYLRQGKYYQQRASHKPGTVQPRHIFGLHPTTENAAT